MYQLTIEPLGEIIEVEEGQNILDAALRAGIYLPHACCHGLCGTCKVDVLEGDAEVGADASPFALMDFERDEGKILACCSTLMSDATIEADIDEEPDARVIPVEDFNGTVSRFENLTPTIKGVFITLDRDIDFQAGQYVQLEIPGEDAPRAFSISNPPGTAREIELNIKLVEGGKGTTWVHEQLGSGDKIKLSAPYGRYFVRKSANLPMIFIAGGSGLSSPRCMIHDLLNSGCAEEITLVQGARDIGELYYKEEFEALAETHDNFTYIPALSDEAPDEWTGFKGFAHDAAKEAFNNDFQNHKAYVCGPPVMIDACITTLMQGRLFERDIYMEKFISAADSEQTRSPLFKKI